MLSKDGLLGELPKMDIAIHWIKILIFLLGGLVLFLNLCPLGLIKDCILFGGLFLLAVLTILILELEDLGNMPDSNSRGLWILGMCYNQAVAVWTNGGL